MQPKRTDAQGGNPVLQSIAACDCVTLQIQHRIGQRAWRIHGERPAPQPRLAPYPHSARSWTAHEWNAE